MRRMLVGMVLVAMVAPAGARAETASKLFLLSAPDGRLAWSVDAADDELRAPTVERLCQGSVVLPMPQCVSGISGSSYTHNLYFPPQTLLDEALPVGPAQPIAFRFGLQVEMPTPLPYTVRLVIEQLNGPRIESTPATEVGPGIWEGTLSATADLLPTRATYLGVRVRFDGLERPGPAARLTMQTDGASWVAPATPVAARAVARLLADSPVPIDPAHAQTDERRFDFNDSQWQLLRFDGTLASSAAYPFSLPARAEGMMVWLERFASPVLHGAGRGDTNARPPTDSYTMDVVREDGSSVGSGFGFSAVNVAPGAMRLRVNPTTGARARPYTGWVLLLFGKRTLAGAQWSAQLNTVSHQTALTGSCASGMTSIPVSDAATTYVIESSVDSPNPSVRWAINWSIPNFGGNTCASATYSRLRVTAPPASVVATFGAVPSRESLGASAFDAMAIFDVRFAYAP